ncbi:MAG TPA: hypothetical protein VMT61_18450 [Candidatus Binataceae bacterium]|nr:hypothetical protein [Candidatus Binataceae bacterium]
MLFPSISTLLAGVGLTAILFVANWLVWSLPRGRALRIDPKAVVLAGPPSHSDLYAAEAPNHHGFMDVA